MQVTSYAESETGDYRLTIVQSGAPTVVAGQTTRDTVTLAMGQ